MSVIFVGVTAVCGEPVAARKMTNDLAVLLQPRAPCCYAYVIVDTIHASVHHT